jgi:hypothetical protein
MSLVCHEVVVFRAAPGVSPQHLADALAGVDALLRAQPGFLSRRTLYDPELGYWMDDIEWDSRSNAMLALKNLNDAPLAAGLFRAIDPSSIRMLHGHAADAGVLPDAQ